MRSARRRIKGGDRVRRLTTTLVVAFVCGMADPTTSHATPPLKCGVHPPKGVEGKALEPLATVFADAAEKVHDRKTHKARRSQ